MARNAAEKYQPKTKKAAIFSIAAQVIFSLGEDTF
jgi:hypothetical protein